MKRRPSIAPKLPRYLSHHRYTIAGRMAVVLFVLGGFWLLTAVNAAPLAISTEAESGRLTGQASAISSAQASAAKAVLFGAKPSGGTPPASPPPSGQPPSQPPTQPPSQPPSNPAQPSGAPAAPTGLKAFTGGTSVALRWTPSATSPASGGAPVSRYLILRGGQPIGMVDPGQFNPNFPEVNGCGYIDTKVKAGQTYHYQVQAVASDGGKSAASHSLSVTQAKQSQPLPEFTIDARQAPDLKAYLKNTVEPFLRIWYPKVAYLIAYPDYTAPDAMTLKLDTANTGIANTSFPASGKPSVIDFNPSYVRGHPKDLGAWLHESSHTDQDYVTGAAVPGWITEGLADWAREYVLHDRYPLPPAPGDGTYQAGYSQGSFFLNWIQNKYDKNFIRKLNVLSHNGHYSDNFFVQTTGKSISQLYAQMQAQYDRGPGPVKNTGNQLCLGVQSGKLAAGTPADAASCGGTDAQKWTLVTSVAQHKSWFNIQTGQGKQQFCLDVKNSGTAAGTEVWVYPCNHTNAQRWYAGQSGTLVNPNSGLCLTPSVGNALVINPCSTAKTQAWQLPS